MSFPAREQFDEEHGDALARLYRYCRKNLTFHEPKEIKGWAAGRVAKIKRQHVSGHLDTLVSDGYLIEHAREHAKQPRRFTLAYEVRRNQYGPGVVHSKSA